MTSPTQTVGDKGMPNLLIA